MSDVRPIKYSTSENNDHQSVSKAKIDNVDNQVSQTNRWYLPTFLLTNIRSLRYKVDELGIVLQTNHVNLCCITESWLDDDVSTECVDIEGYTCYRHDRSDGRRCGGVACYIDNDWPCLRCSSLESDDLETIWLIIRRPLMPRHLSHIAVGVIYHPPDADSRKMSSHIVSCVDNILQQHPHAGVIILGDCNTLNDKTILDYPLKQVVYSPTRGNALLDKIYTNMSDWYLKTTVLPNIGKSDHRTVLMQPARQNQKRNDHHINVTLRSNDRNGKNLLANALVNYNWERLNRMDSVDSMVTFFNETILTLLNTFLPVRIVRRHTSDKPWITDEFRRLIRRRQYAWTSGNHAQYRQLRNMINRQSKELKRQFCSKRVTDLRIVILQTGGEIPKS